MGKSNTNFCVFFSLFLFRLLLSNSAFTLKIKANAKYNLPRFVLWNNKNEKKKLTSEKKKNRKNASEFYLRIFFFKPNEVFDA